MSHIKHIYFSYLWSSAPVNFPLPHSPALKLPRPLAILAYFMDPVPPECGSHEWMNFFCGHSEILASISSTEL